MTLRDRMFELVEPAEVDEFISKYPTGAIFKAGGCHKTMQGFGIVEEALNPRTGIHLGFIRVIESRPASNHVADLTGIVHQSPQLILFVDGKPVFDVDNWEITPEVVQEALSSHFGAAEEGTVAEAASDLSSYKDLLEHYIQGQLMEDEFEARWLETFQMDSTPRSKQEFELLNSLYGDVDAALLQMGGQVDLRARAEELLNLL